MYVHTYNYVYVNMQTYTHIAHACIQHNYICIHVQVRATNRHTPKLNEEHTGVVVLDHAAVHPCHIYVYTYTYIYIQINTRQVNEEGTGVVVWDNAAVHSCRVGLFDEFWLRVAFDSE